MVCDTANWINLHHSNFKTRGLTVSEPMRLDCLLAVLLAMMKGNDPDVGFGVFFTHMNSICICYIVPLQVSRRLMVVSANGWHFVLNISVTTEPLCPCSSSCRNCSGSAVAGCISSFGWELGRLVDTLPYTSFLKWCQGALYTHRELFAASTTPSEREKEEGHQASLSILSTLNWQHRSGSITI